MILKHTLEHEKAKGLTRLGLLDVIGWIGDRVSWNRVPFRRLCMLPIIISFLPCVIILLILGPPALFARVHGLTSF